MKCPHCLVEIHNVSWYGNIGKDIDGEWIYEMVLCPSCNKLIIWIACGDKISLSGYTNGVAFSHINISNEKNRLICHPKGASRPPCPKEVPDNIASDYKEACLVLPDSPKASAALSRRCLQNLLREKAGVTPSDLSNEISEVIKNSTLPGYLTEEIDAIRAIGNFASHPNKSNATGIIVDVEPGEADWSLNVLENLFDFYFVQPATAQIKKEALNLKLKEIGKPPIK